MDKEPRTKRFQQCAIDNAKRSFDVDITSEIKRIKSEIDLAINGYPAFWLVIRRGFNRNKINTKLQCPMNKVYDVKFKMVKPKTPTLPMSNYYVKYELDLNKRISRKIENWIEKYSLELWDYRVHSDHYLDSDTHVEDDNYLLLRQDFEQLVEDIRRIILPNKYIGLMSWLINRAFIVTPSMEGQKNVLKSNLSKNKALLLKVLFSLNSECLLKCFGKNVLKNVPLLET